MYVVSILTRNRVIKVDFRVCFLSADLTRLYRILQGECKQNWALYSRWECLCPRCIIKLGDIVAMFICKDLQDLMAYSFHLFLQAWFDLLICGGATDVLSVNTLLLHSLDEALRAQLLKLMTSSLKPASLHVQLLMCAITQSHLGSWNYIRPG